MESTVNASMNGSFTTTYQQLSPYATYFKMSILFLGTPIVIIIASLIIYIIMKNERLQTKNNYFLMNLLVSDILLVFTNCSINGMLIIMYLFDVDIDVNCIMIVTLTLIPALANKLCFLPVVIDRLLFVALPFDYKLVVTNKLVVITISTLWLVAVFDGCHSNRQHLGVCTTPWRLYFHKQQSSTLTNCYSRPTVNNRPSHHCNQHLFSLQDLQIKQVLQKSIYKYS